MRVEDSDVEIGPFKSTTPEAVSSHVQSGSILSYCGGTSEGFTHDWLQCRLDTNIVADFRQPTINRVTDLIVSDGGEAALGTREGVLHGEVCPTGTVGRVVRGQPSIPQDQGVPKGTLME